MDNKKKFNNKILFIMILILITGIFCYSSFNNSNISDVMIKEGYLNLENWNYSENGSLQLKGEWEFYPYLIASEINMFSSKEDVSYSNIPIAWNNFEYNNEDFGEMGYGTYRVRIKLPINNTFYLKILDVSSAYNLYVDGQLISSNGHVGKNIKSHISESKTNIVQFTTKNNETEILMEISNFSYYKGGFWKAIIIGNLESIIKTDNMAKFFEILVICLLLTASLIYLNLYAYIRKETSFLYLTFFLLTVSLRVLCTGEKLINIILPSITWPLLVKLEFLSYYLAVPVFIIFLFKCFEYNGFNKIIYFSFAFYIINSLIVIFTKPIIFTYMLKYVNSFTFIFGLYFIYIVYQITYKQNKGETKILLAFIILLATVFMEIVLVNSGRETIKYSIVGQMIFLAILIFEVNKRFSIDVGRGRANVTYLEELSNKDSLTKLYNHGFICKKINEIKDNFSNIPYSVAMLDIDDFKLVNDNFGHKSGDLVLLETASILTENTRGSDFVARYGGEEFLLILYNTSLDEAYFVCDKIRKIIEKEIQERTGIKITISGGVAEMNILDQDIIKAADTLLYKAKKSGKNKICK